MGKAELSAQAAELHRTELAASLEIKAEGFLVVVLFFSFPPRENFQNFSVIVEVLAGSVRICWCGQQGWAALDAAGLVSAGAGGRTKICVCKPPKPPGKTRTGLEFL